MSTTKQEIRLNRLSIRNFKGVRDFELNLDGKSANVFGKNESGKSTLVDASMYLLFDKNAKNQSVQKFAIQPLNETGEVIHNLDHIVEAEFDVPVEISPNGKLVLKKVLKENWTKKRGSTIETYQGNTTDYYFDEEPVQQNEWKSRVEEIAPEEVIMMLSNVEYFSSIMEWKDRRRILVDLIGEVNTDKVLEKNPELSRYTEVLDGKTEESRENILVHKRKELKKELDNIPSRIDENQLKIVDVDESEVRNAEKEKEDTDKKIGQISEKIASVKAGGAVVELKKEKIDKESDLVKLKSEHENKVDDALSESKGAVRKAKNILSEQEEIFQNSLRKLNSEKSELLTEFRELKAQKEDIERTVSRIDTKIQAEMDQEPKPEVDGELCPMCERPLEKENEDHSYEEYVKEFNENKAENLKSLNKQKDEALDELAVVQQKLEEVEKTGKQKEQSIQNHTNNKDQKLKPFRDDIEEYERAHQELLEKQPKLEDSEEYAEIKSDINDIEEKLSNHEEETNKQVQLLEGKRQELTAYREEIDNSLNAHKNNELLKKRNEELRLMLSEKANELEDTERDLRVIEEFKAARAEFISGEVNNLFEHASFKLFEQQKNGGYKETCEVLGKNGVGFNVGLNSAQQVQVGLEIISVLSNHYGISFPVFIDNRESVTNLPDTDLQVVSLIVSPEDKQLRVERVNEKEAVLA